MKNTKRILIIIAFTIVSIVLVGSHFFLQKSEGFSKSVAYVETNDNVVQALGAPLSSDLAIFGSSFKTTGTTGSATFRFHIKGVKNTAVAVVHLKQVDGNWIILSANVETDDGVAVDLNKSMH